MKKKEFLNLGKQPIANGFLYNLSRGISIYQ